ncbi:hypothetical protein A2U01_0092476, partial [Trifolium medium]|nr:hypothetical protein [Trifolium medium]
MNKYRYGLRGDIAHAVSLQHIANFRDLIQKAYSATVNQQRKDSGKFKQQLKVKEFSHKG